MTLPSLPTTSWRFKKGTGESKTHYTSDYRRTLCGKRIPTNRESGDGEMCERCIQIWENKNQ
jgi:hypothetical protein